MKKYCISIIVNIHKEGVLLLDCFKSIEKNICKLISLYQVDVEIIAIIDDPDTKTLFIVEKIKNQFNDNSRINFYIKIHHLKDIGKSRNAGIMLSKGDFLYFIDGDDIWGNSWLLNSYLHLISSNEKCISHPQFSFIFGSTNEYYLRESISTNSEFFNSWNLYFENYWTSSFASHHSLFDSITFKGGELNPKCKYAYEDWSFYRESIEKQISHCVIDKTVHFIRKKNESNTKKTLQFNLMPWPSELYKKIITKI